LIIITSKVVIIKKMSTWKEFDSFYLHISTIHSNDFYNARKGCISGTKVYSAIGLDPYLTREDLVDIMTGKIKKNFTPEQQEHMERGKKDEVHILQTYTKANPHFKVYKFEEYEFPVSKVDSWLRGIPDSVIIQNDIIVGIVECKSKEYFNGEISQKDYCQILLYMFIFNAKWCDFMVYITSENKYVQIRIDFNVEDWNEIYEKLCEFKEKYLFPALKGKKYPVHPPK
jgi:hypothetical protein